MKKYIKRYKFIFLSFIFMSLFFSLEISKFEKTKLNMIESNDFFTYESKIFHISSSKITENTLIKTLSKYEKIFLQKKYLQFNEFSGSEVYFNYTPKYIPNIIRGRYFNLEDFKSTDLVAVVGRNLTKNIFKKNNIEYIFINDNEYKIIGIMGGEGSSLNDKFMINFNPYNLDNYINEEEFYQLENNNFQILNNLKNDLNYLDSKIKILEDSSLNVINPINGYVKYRIYYITFIFVIFTISTINISNFYMSKREKEIGILKSIGIKNLRIYFKIIFEYEIMSIVSFVMGLIIHYLLYIFIYNNQLYYYINFKNLGVVVIISLIVGFIGCYIPLVRLIKISPIKIMKR